jgi:2-furoyl-CoA dehydrogenase FAD binding subunit
MKPPAFDYRRAETLEEVLDVLDRHGPDARVIAGGQSLMPMLNMRLARPAVLVDIMRISSLANTAAESGVIVIPAAVRQAAFMRRPSLASESPLLHAALPWVGHYQTRARGTLCGSVAHADPSAEIPLCLVALGGEIRLRSRKRMRRIKAEDFFTGVMSTERRDDEMIEAIAIPVASSRHGYAFAEVGRRHGDFAIVACAAVAAPDGLRLAVGGVADAPAVRQWPALAGDALDDVLNAFAWELEAREDIHATARFRRDLVRRLGRKVLEEAIACRI